MAPPPTQTNQSPAQVKNEQFDANILVASTTVVAVIWLIIGGVAHGREDPQASPPVWAIVHLLSLVHLAVAATAIVFIDFGWPGRGTQLFTSGMAGFGIVACTIATQATSISPKAIFWSLSGFYAGCLVEHLARPFASLSDYLNDAASANLARAQPAVRSG